MATKFEFIFPMDETVKDRDGKDKKWLLDDILKVVESHNCKYIVSPHPVDEESSFRHWHVGIKTTSDNLYETIAKWFNMPTNACQKIRKQFETTYALYLIHYNQGEKTEVDPGQVISNFDIDYDKLIERIEQKVSDDEVLDKLVNGEMSEYDLYRNYSPSWLRKHKRDIDIALQVRSKRSQVRKEERNMEVVYITGQPRSGKSYLAVKLCEQNGYSYYRNADGKNPFDDYMGQDAVILDDIRPSDFKFSDLLKVLDNHMSSKVSARYHNIDLNCKMMILTSVIPLGEFYKNLQESNGEAVEQLRGRIGMVCDVSKDTVKTYILKQDNRTYELLGEMPNPILTDEEINLMTEEQRMEKAIKMLGGLGSMMVKASEMIQDIPKGFIPVDDGDQIEF